MKALKDKDVMFAREQHSMAVSFPGALSLSEKVDMLNIYGNQKCFKPEAINAISCQTVLQFPSRRLLYYAESIEIGIKFVCSANVGVV